MLSLIRKGRVVVVTGERNTSWWARIVVWTQRTCLWWGYCCYRTVNGQHSVVSVKMTHSHLIFDPKVFCSAELNAGLHNQLICFTIVRIIVALTAIVGNTLILIALYKEISLHQPSKILLCMLSGIKWPLPWLLNASFCALLDILIVETEMAIVPARVFRVHFSERYFVCSVFVHNNCHKCGQTSRPVVRN